eukprot:15136841-Heterocapsa_arctica.AAC.1
MCRCSVGTARLASVKSVSVKVTPLAFWSSPNGVSVVLLAHLYQTAQTVLPMLVPGLHLGQANGSG